MAERLGLWFARMALRLTGNSALANASRVLPLIPQRRLLICVRPVDVSLFERVSAGTWALWKSQGPICLNVQNFDDYLGRRHEVSLLV
jgi:hypothetical protein